MFKTITALFIIMSLLGGATATTFAQESPEDAIARIRAEMEDPNLSPTKLGLLISELQYWTMLQSQSTRPPHNLEARTEKMRRSAERQAGHANLHRVPVSGRIAGTVGGR